MIYKYDDIKDNVELIKDKIIAEYKCVRISTLGGRENSTIMIWLSLDKKENWMYDIFQNSRYYHFSIDNNGVVENFQNSYKVKKIRKKKVKTLEEAIEYINKKIKEAKEQE